MMMRKLLVAMVALMLVSGAAMAQTADVWTRFFPQGLLDRDGKEVSLDTLKGKMVGIYFSAGWCSYCQAFSPKLVPFRNANSKDFEVVFVSSDKNETAQFKYMSDYGMFWPTLKFQSMPVFELKKRFNITILPTLIVLSPNGELISSTARVDVSQDPEGAIAKWKATTPQPVPEIPAPPAFGVLPATDRLAVLNERVVAEEKALRAQPKQAWVKGTIAGKAYDLKIDRVAWTITGTAGGQTYDLKIDHQARTIKGYALDSGIDLTFTWSSDEVGFDGEAYGYPYWVNISWPKAHASGGIACSLLELDFNLNQGTVNGTLGDKQTSLKYDAISGRLTGQLFRKPVDLQLTNLDLSDFLQHLYLFIR